MKKDLFKHNMIYFNLEIIFGFVHLQIIRFAVRKRIQWLVPFFRSIHPSYRYGDIIIYERTVFMTNYVFVFVLLMQIMFVGCAIVSALFRRAGEATLVMAVSQLIFLFIFLIVFKICLLYIYIISILFFPKSHSESRSFYLFKRDKTMYYNMRKNIITFLHHRGVPLGSRGCSTRLICFLSCRLRRVYLIF